MLPPDERIALLFFEANGAALVLIPCRALRKYATWREQDEASMEIEHCAAVNDVRSRFRRNRYACVGRRVLPPGRYVGHAVV